LTIGIADAEIRGMSPAIRTSAQRLKSVVSSLLAGLVVMLSLVAASESLHQGFHGDSDRHHSGSCAVCRVVEGHMDAPETVVSEVLVPLSVSWTVPHPEDITPHATDFSMTCSRGPPFLLSSV
jgi:hypothetical protein